MSLKFAGTPEHENIPKQEQVTLQYEHLKERKKHERKNLDN